jgi:uncharacterized protein DUF6011
MNIKDIFTEAVDVLGPVSEVVLRDRKEHFTIEEFDPFFALLQDDLIAFIKKVVQLEIVHYGKSSFDTNDMTDKNQAWSMAYLIRTFAYGHPAQDMSQPLGASALPVTPPPVAPSPNGGSAALTVTPGTVAVPSATLKAPQATATGTNPCYNRGCGLKFETFEEIMAHKVIVHNYSHSKYTQGWARDFMATYSGLTVQVAAQLSQPVQDPNPDPNKITQSALWQPKLNLNLHDLGLEVGEASRFAVGTKDTARFYFIRRVGKATSIRGKFVWTMFAHRFNSESVYVGDYVVRKLAGDTKEWVGLQRKSGVWRRSLGSSQHEDIYVGDHEDDIAEILADPHIARVKYGQWRQECGYCGRNLTDWESRLRGIGPDCWENKGKYAALARVKAITAQNAAQP